MNEFPGGQVPHGDFPGVVPVLEGDHVRLRAMTERDLPSLVEQSNDPLCVAWTGVAQPYGLDEARSFLTVHEQEWAGPRGRRYWAVELLPGDTPGLPFAGIINVRPSGREGDAWETGFSLHPAARGRGAMSAALRLAAGWAFDHGASSLRGGPPAATSPRGGSPTPSGSPTTAPCRARSTCGSRGRPMRGSPRSCPGSR